MNIGEVAKASGITAKMIRYYEEIGLIQAAQRHENDYRHYTNESLEVLRFIRRSRDLGFSLDRIKVLLSLWQDRSRKSSEVKALAKIYIQELDQQIEKLNSIRSQLERLHSCCHGDERPNCPILDDLSK
jgi:MerR family copper efflux transcriptional regulator